MAVDDIESAGSVERWCDSVRAAAGDMAEFKLRWQAAMVVALAIGRCHPEDAVQVLAAALEDLSAGGPCPAFLEATRADAEWWADCASPPELEAYAGAALRRIERRAFGIRARKRIFAALWETFDAEDKRAFIARVDPKGRFRGRAA